MPYWLSMITLWVVLGTLALFGIIFFLMIFSFTIDILFGDVIDSRFKIDQIRKKIHGKDE